MYMLYRGAIGRVTAPWLPMTVYLLCLLKLYAVTVSGVCLEDYSLTRSVAVPGSSFISTLFDTGTVNSTWWTAEWDEDNMCTSFLLPEPFYFYGQIINEFHVSDAGLINFRDSECDVLPQDFPNNPESVISVWWSANPPNPSLNNREVGVLFTQETIQVQWNDPAMRSQVTIDVPTGRIAIYLEYVSSVYVSSYTVLGLAYKEQNEVTGVWGTPQLSDYSERLYEFDPRVCRGTGTCSNDVCVCEVDWSGDSCEHCECSCPPMGDELCGQGCVACAVDEEPCSCAVTEDCNDYEPTCLPSYYPPTLSASACSQYELTPGYTKNCTAQYVTCPIPSAYCEGSSGCEENYYEVLNEQGYLLCEECPICLNGGECGGNGGCLCPTGTNGEFCQYSDAVNCNGYGTVEYDGQCTCDFTFAGDSCDECAGNYYDHPNCVYCVAEQSANGCNSHGTCNDLGGCDCQSNYIGDSCEDCAPNFYNYPSCTGCVAATTCNSNGICDSETGLCVCDAGNFAEPNCDCEDGYWGEFCDPCPSSNGGVCGGAAVGICDDGLDGSGTCDCIGDYYGDACQNALPVVYFISPTSAPLSGVSGGSRVQLTIVGSNFVQEGGTPVILMGEYLSECELVSYGASSIVCNIPASSHGTSALDVNVDGQDIDCGCLFTYQDPTLDSVVSQDGLITTDPSDDSKLIRFHGSLGLESDTRLYYGSTYENGGDMDTGGIVYFVDDFTAFNETQATFTQDALACEVRSMGQLFMFLRNVNSDANTDASSNVVDVSALSLLPYISSVSGTSPTKGGGDVVLHGANFGCNADIITVEIVLEDINPAPSGLFGTNIVVTDAEISFDMPSGVGSVTFVVTIGDNELPDFKDDFVYDAPDVQAVSGCVDNGFETEDCNTEDPTVITISGASFGPVEYFDDINVYIEGIPCSDLVAIDLDSETEVLECLMQAQGGFKLEVQVERTLQGNSRQTGVCPCVSFFGPEIVPETLRFDSVVMGPSNQLELPSTGASTTVWFEADHISELANIQIYFGEPDYDNNVLINRLQCTDIDVSFLVDSRYTISCIVGPGIGVDLLFQLEMTENEATLKTKLLTGETADSVSYPGPIINPEQLSFYGASPTNITNGASHVQGAQNDDEVLILYGDNFGVDYTQVVVKYGTFDTVFTAVYTAEVLPDLTNHNSIVFSTSRGEGGPYVFEVDVLGQKAVSVDTYKYPDIPRITNILGCGEACPTDALDENGNQKRIFILGTELGERDTRVFVGGAECYNVNVEVPFLNISCDLPIGVGNDLIVTAVRDDISSNLEYTMSYAKPIITDVIGCEPTEAASKTINCPREGSVVITLRGSDFGRANALVFIGDVLCEPLIHDETNPYGEVFCTVPPGVMDDLNVILLQDKGLFSDFETAKLSYSQCPAGYYDVGDVECVQCLAGSYTGENGRESCLDCPLGQFTPNNGSTTCTKCDYGYFMSERGSTSCEPCDVGYFTPSLGLSKCIPCATGTYADKTSMSTCLSCDAGTYQDGTARTTCTNCTIGTAVGLTASSQVCEPCTDGSYANKAGLTTCLSCDAGRVSLADHSDCVDCDIGKYSNGHVSCQNCRAGTFMATTGASECENCLAGKYSDVDGLDYCLDCPAGTAAAYDGASHCANCSAGFFSDEGSSSCTPCKRGRYQAKEGQNFCVDCEPGKFQSIEGQGSCLPCASGMEARNSGQTNCTQCPLGRHSDISNYPEQAAQCAYCPVGKFADVTGVAECFSCSVGTYSLSEGAYTCTKCEAGRFTAAPGQSDCQTCGPGYYSYASATSCQSCQRGRASNSSGTSECILCEKNHYQKNEGATSCPMCPAGKDTAYTGAYECADCDAGKFTSTDGETCELCAIGKFQDDTGATTCQDSYAGYFTFYVGAHSPLPPCAAGSFTEIPGVDGTICGGEEPTNQCCKCEAGMYQNTTGATLCNSCTAGRITSSAGQVECDSCDVGFYQATTGQTSCPQCLVGTYSDTPGSSTCTNCQPGEYVPLKGQSEALPCEKGTYSDEEAQVQCTQCPVGSFQNATGQSRCYACRPGTSNIQTGQVKCEECISGTYQDDQSATACNFCQLGRSQGQPGGTTCVDCVVGRYATYTGLTSCIDCPVGRYTAINATDRECAKCPLGKHQSLKASTACVVCEVGRFSEIEGNIECTECPEGEYNEFTNRTACDQCELGYHNPYPGASTCVECARGKYTDVYGMEICDNCEVGRVNNATGSTTCTNCEPGYYQVGEGQFSCLLSPAGSYSPTGEFISVCEGVKVQPLEGKTFCIPCVENSYVDSAHIECLCEAGYYLETLPDAYEDVNTGEIADWFKCQECPSGADCGTPGVTFETLATLPGWWRADNESLEFYQCQEAFHCEGGIIQGAEAASPCGEGRTGPLCSGCQDGYSLLANGYCGPCPETDEGSFWYFGLIALVMFLGGCLVFAYAIRRDRFLFGIIYAKSFGLVVDDHGIIQKEEPANVDSSFDADADGDEKKAHKRNTTISKFTKRKKRGSIMGAQDLRKSSSDDYNPDHNVLDGTMTAAPEDVLPTIDDVEQDSDDDVIDMGFGAGGGLDGDDVNAMEDVETKMEKSPEDDPEEGYYSKQKKKTYISKRKDPVLRSFVNNQQLKVLIGLYQILSALTATLIFPWPEGYKRFLGQLDFLNLEVVKVTSAECVTEINYLTTYITYVVSPFGVTLLFIGFYFVPQYLYYHRFSGLSMEDIQKHVHFLRLKLLKMWIVFLLLAFPRVSATILQVYGCQQIDSIFYLKADLSIECNTEDWNLWASLNIFAVLLYPVGIPMLFLYLVRRVNKLQLFHDRETQYTVGVLFLPYREDMWWFEFVDMLHKLIMTSIIGILPLDIEIQFALVVALAYLLLILLGNPYEEIMDYRLHIMAQVEIMLCLLAEYVFYKADLWEDPESDTIFSVVLILLILFFFTTFLYNICLKLYRQRWFQRVIKPCRPCCMEISRPCRWCINRLEERVETIKTEKVVVPKPEFRFRTLR